jgi:hypothetical protein
MNEHFNIGFNSRREKWIFTKARFWSTCFWLRSKASDSSRARITEREDRAEWAEYNHQRPFSGRLELPNEPKHIGSNEHFNIG